MIKVDVYTSTMYVYTSTRYVYNSTMYVYTSKCLYWNKQINATFFLFKINLQLISDYT